jgi:hypothetical protein
MTRQASGISERGPVRDHDWTIALRPERDIAPTGLGMCEFCEFDVLAGSEIASVNDGRYAHFDCVPWGDEEDGE